MPLSVSPSLPELKCCETWIVEALRRSGARADMGICLHHTYRDAGFVDSTTMVSHLSGCGLPRPMVEFFVETLRSMLPRILEYGIATPDEVGIDTLADRMFARACEADPQWVGSRCISAWARKP